LLGVLLWLSPQLALGWNASGHMQIALSSYGELPPELQQRLVALLRQHPRFSEDFLPHLPPHLQGDEERARFIFAHAATWPDIARGQPQYERASWHYVNLRLHLHSAGLVSCAEARAALPESVRRVAEHKLAEQKAPQQNLVEPGPTGTAPAQPAEVSDSIIEAIARAQRTLSDRAVPAADRALALTWLLHLVGDAHQPLHGVALFTDKRFITGDRGGNDIVLRQRGSLHRVWDGLLGEDVSLSGVQRQVDEWRADPYLARVRMAASTHLDVNSWIDEGCAIARTSVYVPAILSAVRRFETTAAEGKPEVSLADAYVGAARAAARRRAVQAGARLAALLRSLPMEP
jgi:hypothetical protein